MRGRMGQRPRGGPTEARSEWNIYDARGLHRRLKENARSDEAMPGALILFCLCSPLHPPSRSRLLPCGKKTPSKFFSFLRSLLVTYLLFCMMSFPMHASTGSHYSILAAVSHHLIHVLPPSTTIAPLPTREAMTLNWAAEPLAACHLAADHRYRPYYAELAWLTASIQHCS